MTVSADRTLDNYGDTARKIPASALAPSVLTGLAIERIVGPAADATVQLSLPAESVALILAHLTADGKAGVNALAPIEGTDYSVVLEGATSGVCEITEGASVSRATETWTVFYVPKAVDPTPGGQTTI